MTIISKAFVKRMRTTCINILSKIILDENESISIKSDFFLPTDNRINPNTDFTCNLFITLVQEEFKTKFNIQADTSTPFNCANWMTVYDFFEGRFKMQVDEQGNWLCRADVPTSLFGPISSCNIGIWRSRWSILFVI